MKLARNAVSRLSCPKASRRQYCVVSSYHRGQRKLKVCYCPWSEFNFFRKTVLNVVTLLCGRIFQAKTHNIVHIQQLLIYNVCRFQSFLLMHSIFIIITGLLQLSLSEGTRCLQSHNLGYTCEKRIGSFHSVYQLSIQSLSFVWSDPVNVE